MFPRPSVSAVILEGNDILLVKRGCEPNLGCWSLPGGSIEPGESMREAVVREVWEETCLQVEPERVAGAYDVIVRRDGEILFHYVIICFVVKVASGEPMAASDAADLRWVGLSEVPAYNITPGLADRLLEMGILQ